MCHYYHLLIYYIFLYEIALWCEETNDDMSTQKIWFYMCTPLHDHPLLLIYVLMNMCYYLQLLLITINKT